jgi:hypothetical protein
MWKTAYLNKLRGILVVGLHVGEIIQQWKEESG